MQLRSPRPSESRHSIARTIIECTFAAAGATLLGGAGPTLFNFLVALASGGEQKAYYGTWISTVIPLALLGLVGGWLLGSKFARGIEIIGLRWDKLEQGDKVTLFVGVFAGLVMSIPVNTFFQAMDSTNQDIARAKLVIIPAVAIGLSALSVYALQSMAEILPWNRGRVATRRSGIKILDTNVIIDGRIYEVLKAGFMEGQIYVPRFVLEELQHIADSSDALRRGRGRRGLEILGHMQTEFDVEVGVHDRHAPDPKEEVDSRIVRVARAIGADVVTNDWNLNRVANLQDVRVMSLNDLALAMRTNVLPQETLPVKIIREGNQPGQGVGYLDDGTMIVVEGGGGAIGESIPVIVTQVIQTERGKMVFADAEGTESIPRPERRPRPTPRRSTAG